MDREHSVSPTGWALWITGLPGCGKSTLADGLADILRNQGRDVRLLRMDELRKTYVPEPKYTAEEREFAYGLLARDAARLVSLGRGVVVDATAHRLTWRKALRGAVSRFAEIHLHCAVKTAIERESGRPEGLVMAGLYQKALARKAGDGQVDGLGDVVGVDVLFETDPNAECVIECDGLSPEEVLVHALSFVDVWLPD